MNARRFLSTLRFFTLILTIDLVSNLANSAGLTSVSDEEWNETAVRRVLHTFAYGGFASDTQITTWADLPPQTAIGEILSFAAINPKLSPVVDTTGVNGTNLESLQTYWSSEQVDNLVCPDERRRFRQTYVRADGNTVLYNIGLQNTWIAMVNTRGLNPFAQRVGSWLTQYHMAVNLHDTEPPLIADLYDQALFDLASHQPFHRVLANGASSAAVAREYGHRQNTYNNNTGVFKGNDDFAREFHQLFFRINGVTENPDYHENTTIEHTAWALSGTQLDKSNNAYGTTLASDWWVAPIDFTDHLDDTGRYIRNLSRHPAIDLEIYHTQISGTTAQEKLYQLAAVAGNHVESLQNLPVAIIRFFADDNLNAEKINAIRAEWKLLAGQPDDFLNFLRAYAISREFHSIDTFKYRTAFHRNLTLYNLNTVDNKEHYGNSVEPRLVMKDQGADVFIPLHDVFGGQTSFNAANNPDLFKEAFNKTVNSPNRIIKTREVCHDTNGVQQSVWLKNWASVIPADTNGQWTAFAVGEWLWQHFIGDGGKNYTPLEHAQVTALLATGFDLAYLVDLANLDISYSSTDITSTLAPLVFQNDQTLIDLDNPTISIRREANRRVGMAIAFISMTPFSFAMEGNLIAVAPEIIPGGDRVEMQSSIEVVTGKYLIVNGNKVWVVANTIIKFDGDTSGKFEVGQNIDLKAQPNVDGSFTATKISISAGTTPPPGNSAPTAMINGPYSGVAAQAVAFSSAGSSDPDNDPLTYSWDFGDGATSTLANPSHGYAVAGTFNVSLRVDDGNGGTHTAFTTADIVAPPPGNSAPTAMINGPYSGIATQTVAFSSSGSSDPDNDPLTYSWDFGDGATSTQSNPSHSYAVTGTFNVSLRVDDGNGGTHTAFTTADIAAAQPAPTVGKIELGGVISSVSGDQFVVSGISIYVTSTTKLSFEGGIEPVLVAGQAVELVGVQNNDGSVTAIKIAVK